MPAIPKAIKYLELAHLEDWNCDKITQLENAEYEIMRAKEYYKKHDDSEQKKNRRDM